MLNDNLIFSNEMYVTHQDTLGTDLSIVNSARISLNREHTKIDDKDLALLSRLIADRHGTPFEHAIMSFKISVPIFVERQWRTHRFSSFNEQSARYTEYEPKFWLPSEDEVRSQKGKNMSYEYENISNTFLIKDIIDVIKVNSLGAYYKYKGMLEEGIAKELARIVLPVNTYTSFIWTVNLRSLFNFLSLRTDIHAQSEIRKAAGEVELLLEDWFPHCWNAWNENGRPSLGGVE
jgi:thymidylate synthase (FAD)